MSHDFSQQPTKATQSIFLPFCSHYLQLKLPFLNKEEAQGNKLQCLWGLLQLNYKTLKLAYWVFSYNTIRETCSDFVGSHILLSGNYNHKPN